MAEANLDRPSVDQFILEKIDSVPHLEALLLLWKTRPKLWSDEDMAQALYISVDRARTILFDLKQGDLVTLQAERFSYRSGSRRDLLIEEVDSTYRRELVRVSNMIHSKAPSAVREFARAFRFKKD
jgi:hypothetical protein